MQFFHERISLTAINQADYCKLCCSSICAVLLYCELCSFVPHCFPRFPNITNFTVVRFFHPTLQLQSSSRGAIGECGSTGVLFRRRYSQWGWGMASMQRAESRGGVPVGGILRKLNIICGIYRTEESLNNTFFFLFDYPQ